MTLTWALHVALVRERQGPYSEVGCGTLACSTKPCIAPVQDLSYGAREVLSYRQKDLVVKRDVPAVQVVALVLS